MKPLRPPGGFREKDRAIKMLVEFIDYPERFGCQITPIRSDGHGNKVGMIWKGTAALDLASVGEVCTHRVLGTVCVRWIDGHRAGVTDPNNTEHTVDVRSCKRIL